MLFVQLVMISLFSELTFIPYALALSTSVGEVLKFTIAAAPEDRCRRRIEGCVMSAACVLKVG